MVVPGAGALLVASALSVGAAAAWKPVLGAPLPPWRGADLAGRAAGLDAWDGDVRLVNLWATWCLPCREEMPRLAELHRQRSAEGLVVVGISLDRPEAGDQVREVVQDLAIPYPVLVDPGETAADVFDAVALPVNLLFDRRGKLVWTRVGRVEDEDPELDRALDAALADVPHLPDPDSGNIAHEPTEPLGGARAAGPLAQGLAAAVPEADTRRPR